MKVVAVLLAAGSGTRTKEKIPKQVLHIHGRLLLQNGLDSLLKAHHYERVIIVASKTTYKEISNLIKATYGEVPVEIVLGGPTRQESTKRAIRHIVRKKITCDSILFHDAARVFVDSKDFNTVIRKSTKKDGAIFTETLRGSIPIFIEKNKIVKHDRQLKFVTHTPECYNFEIIKKIYLDSSIKYNSSLTNLELMLLFEKKIIPVFSNNLNLKITFAEDVAFLKSKIR